MRVVFCTDSSATLETEILEVRGRIQSGTSRASARGTGHHWPFDSDSRFESQRNYAVLNWVIAALLFAASGTARATTFNAASPSLADVTDAINSAADGDTIIVPRGTAAWKSTVKITKGITLIGQTTTDPMHRTANDQTIILDSVPRPTNNTPLIVFNTVPGKSYRLSGITFRTGTELVNYNGMIQLTGHSQAVRLDNCHFDDLLYENNYIATDGQIYGVIDHNLFDFRDPKNNREAIRLGASGWGGANYGDGPWAAPAYYGSEKFIFIEDNCFNDTTGHTNATVDDWDGARWVLRHNHMYDMDAQTHGTEIGLNRGSRCAEMYNNDFHWTVQISALGGIRSGGLITHDNAHDGVRPGGGMTLQPYRIFIRFPDFWGGASGDNPWDNNVTEPDGTHVDGHPPYLFESGTAGAGSNQTTIVDTTKNWTPNRWAGYTAKRVSDNGIMTIAGNSNNRLTGYYHSGYGGGVTWQVGDQYQIHRVLIALDQPGRGRGDLINRNNPAWPHQALEPCYSWNDIYTPTGAHINMGLGPSAFAVLQEGRDYFNETRMPGYTPYTYPHPLTKSLPPPQSTGSMTLTSGQNFSKNSENEAKKARRKKWGHAKENLANELTQPQ
jgi:hypothetical protein